MAERKRVLIFGLVLLSLAAIVGLGLYLRRTPKRVWVTYSERYEDFPGQQDYKQDAKQNEELRLFAEERLVCPKHSIVLTHDRQNADYVVTIDVVRYVSSGPPDRPPVPGGLYGGAHLSITKRNGDVALVESFLQNENSKEDIGQMPVTRTWEYLCRQKWPR